MKYKRFHKEFLLNLFPAIYSGQIHGVEIII